LLFSEQVLNCNYQVVNYKKIIIFFLFLGYSLQSAGQSFGQRPVQELTAGNTILVLVFQENTPVQEMLVGWITEAIKQIPRFIPESIDTKKIVLFIDIKKISNTCQLTIKKEIWPEYQYRLFCKILKKKENTGEVNHEKILKRALVENLVYLADQNAKWSKTYTWLSINRWKAPLENITTWDYESQNLSLKGYVQPEARENPSREFSLFASHYLIPDELYENVVPDLSVRCHLMAQSDYLEDLIEKKSPGFIPVIKQKTTVCPAFEKWANIGNIDYMEVVFAHPSALFIGSLFGHVLLRLVPFEQNGVRPINDTRAFGFLAMTHQPIESDPFSAIKGILGMYNAMFAERPFRDVYLQYALTENRDMDSWKMNIDRKTLKKLMGRFWTIRQTTLFRYRFFTENCGSFLIDTINGALPENQMIKYPHDTGSMPSATMEGYINAKDPENNSLFTLSSDHFTSLKSEMMDAVKKRKVFAKKILLMSRNTRLSNQVFKDAESTLESKRDNAYRIIFEHSMDKNNFQGERSDQINNVYSYFGLSISVENYLLAVDVMSEEKKINHKRMQQLQKKVNQLGEQIHHFISQYCNEHKPENNDCFLKRDLLRTQTDNIFSPDFNKRMETYTIINKMDLSSYEKTKPGYFSAMFKAYVVLNAYLKYDLPNLLNNPEFEKFLFEDTKKILSEQPYLPKEVSIAYLYAEKQISKTVTSLLEYKYKIKEYNTDSKELDISLQDDNKNSLRNSYSFPHTGVDMIYSGYYYRQKGFVPEHGVFIQTALIDEVIGENREAGFPYYSGMSVLKNKIQIGLSPQKPSVSAFDLTLIEYRILQPYASVEKKTLADTGWGFLSMAVFLKRQTDRKTIGNLNSVLPWLCFIRINTVFYYSAVLILV